MSQPVFGELFRHVMDVVGEESEPREPTLRLDPKLQWLLALWASKSANVMEYMGRNPTPLIPPDHAFWVFKHRQPPPNYAIWMGCFDEGGTNMVAFHRCVPMGIPGFGMGFVSTFTIGYVVFQIVGTMRLDEAITFSMSDDEFDGGIYADQLLRIWPTDPTGVGWPPDTCFDHELLDGLSSPAQISTPTDPSPEPS